MTIWVEPIFPGTILVTWPTDRVTPPLGITWLFVYIFTVLPGLQTPTLALITPTLGVMTIHHVLTGVEIGADIEAVRPKSSWGTLA